jgi:hypothetical protein
LHGASPHGDELYPTKSANLPKTIFFFWIQGDFLEKISTKLTNPLSYYGTVISLFECCMVAGQKRPICPKLKNKNLNKQKQTNKGMKTSQFFSFSKRLLRRN